MIFFPDLGFLVFFYCTELSYHHCVHIYTDGDSIIRRIAKPNNLWVLYILFNHSDWLWDISIETGGNFKEQKIKMELAYALFNRFKSHFSKRLESN